MKYLFLLFIISTFSLNAQTQDAWVYFNDKPNENTYFDSPLTMLSQRSLDRRIRYNIPLDSKDVPIEYAYIELVRNSAGISIKAKSKWLNALHIRGTQTNIEDLLNLSCVQVIDFADKSLNSSGKTNEIKTAAKHNDKLDFTTDFTYGNAANQIEMLKGDILHKKGFTGEGMQIAVIDGGFYNVDNIDAFKRIRDNNQILGGYNFVNRSDDFYSGHYHGMSVLSTIAAYVENKFVGTAPDAKFYLFITEDVASETPLEESLWVEAAEKADSLGVDILNTSLGYTTFDNPNYDYSYNDLDGETAFITRGAEISFSRGMIVVNSAGNSGNNSWKYVGAPADAKSVLTIGAVNSTGVIASFSSYGPTSDGRVKPDVCAQGQGTSIINTSGNISSGNGTSFSSPVMAGVIACLWQSSPNKSNVEIIQQIKESAHLYNFPTAQEGYGIPDFEAVYNYFEDINYVEKITAFPNPINDNLNFNFPDGTTQVDVSFINTLGQVILLETATINKPYIDVSFLKSGLYLLQFKYENTVEHYKIMKY